MAGSIDKRDRILAGKATIEEVYHESKDALYQWRKVGDILSPATATTAGAAVSNAYEVAKAGGKNFKRYKLQLDLGYRQLQKGVRSFEKQIKDHEGWLRDPQSKVKGWESRSPAYREGLLKKWQQDISRHREQIAILRGVLQEKGYGE